MLAQSHAYLIQYELDGSREVHDPAQPFTTNCPYLPGQPVNTIHIPVEQSLRQRSASLSSLHDEDYRTMDPASKYVSPQPTEQMLQTRTTRFDTAPCRSESPIPFPTKHHVLHKHRPTARSVSPAGSSSGSSWRSLPRKLFSRKASSSSLQSQRSDTPIPSSLPAAAMISRPTTAMGVTTETADEVDDRSSVRSLRSLSRSSSVERSASRCERSTIGSRSRDISPESLRRFLYEDEPAEGVRVEKDSSEQKRSLARVQDDRRERSYFDSDSSDDNEENDDDDDDIYFDDEDDINFATSAVSESFPTSLSPPPAQRALSPPPATTNTINNRLKVSPPTLRLTAHRPAPLNIMTPSLPRPPDLRSKFYVSPAASPSSPSEPPSPPPLGGCESSSEESDGEEEVTVEKHEHHREIVREASKHGAAAAPSLPAISEEGTDQDLMGELMSELGWMSGLIHHRSPGGARF